MNEIKRQRGGDKIEYIKRDIGKEGRLQQMK